MVTLKFTSTELDLLLSATKFLLEECVLNKDHWLVIESYENLISKLEEARA